MRKSSISLNAAKQYQRLPSGVNKAEDIGIRSWRRHARASERPGGVYLDFIPASVCVLGRHPRRATGQRFSLVRVVGREPPPPRELRSRICSSSDATGDASQGTNGPLVILLKGAASCAARTPTLELHREEGIPSAMSWPKVLLPTTGTHPQSAEAARSDAHSQGPRGDAHRSRLKWLARSR